MLKITFKGYLYHYSPFSIRNNFHSILEPFNFGVILLTFQFEFNLIVFNAVFAFEFVCELMGKF